MEIGIHDFWCFLLILARVSALVAAAPVFGTTGVPAPVKAGFSALVSLVLLPLLRSTIGPAPGDLFTLIARIAADIAVGLTLGFLVTLLFAAVQIAGTYVDTQIGFGMINVLNPVARQQTSATGQLMYQLSMALFLMAGGMLYLVGAVAASYRVVPAGAAHFAGSWDVVAGALAGQMLLIALRIAAPAAAVLLTVDLAFALVARTVPQMNVLIVGLPAKIILGLATVSLSLPVLALAVQEDILPALDHAARMILNAAR
ncbi:MAG: flagellar biosynthetic protein FliR [Chthonomonadales bacterium]